MSPHLLLWAALARADDPPSPPPPAPPAPSEAAAPAPEAAAPAPEAAAPAPEAAAKAAPTPDDIATWLDSVVVLTTGGAFCAGVVIDEEGTIATAYHCIASGQRPRVETRGGLQATGRTLAGWPKADLALVSAPELAGKVTPRPIRDAPPRPGERVYGLGHPFAPMADRARPLTGLLRWSVTEGIVSATGAWMLQTDAALNPGNSGGPVVDASGAVIGITSRKLSGDNLAFATTVEKLRELQADPRRLQPWGGVWGFGLSLVGPTPSAAAASALSSAVQLRTDVAFRERLVLAVGVGLWGPDRTSTFFEGVVVTPDLEASASLRQRFGSGAWSTAIDLGGGVYGTSGLRLVENASTGRPGFAWTDPTLDPGLAARVSFGGIGLRGVAVLDGGPPTTLLALDLDIPGLLVIF